MGSRRKAHHKGKASQWTGIQMQMQSVAGQINTWWVYCLQAIKLNFAQSIMEYFFYIPFISAKYTSSFFQKCELISPFVVCL